MDQSTLPFSVMRGEEEEKEKDRRTRGDRAQKKERRKTSLKGKASDPVLAACLAFALLA